MSRDSQEKSAEVREELIREFRQFNELGASFFRVAASRVGLAVTDIQVLDILDLSGPSTAGRLAELTGLTTGAITRILDRLEEAGLVHREHDPNDGRKIIVRFAEDTSETHKVHSSLASTRRIWGEIAARYEDEQIAFLLEFFKQSNALSRQELVEAQQEESSDQKRSFSAPLEDQASGRLVVSGGAAQVNVHANVEITGLYLANFEGPLPGVKTKNGAVTIRYSRRLLGLGQKQGVAKIGLTIAIPWRITIQGGAAEAIADLSGLQLVGLELKGGFSMIRLDLPAPTGRVPIRINGSAPEITVRRPTGAAARLNFKGWTSELVFDDQTASVAGNIAQLQSLHCDPTAPYYDIEITSYSNRVTITSG